MLLTTKARYAVMAVIEIAGTADNVPVSLLLISKKHNISLSYLEQIFAELKKNGLVKSVRGPGGGYTLNHPKDQITIATIIKAIGESIKMTRCSVDKEGCQNMQTKCKTHHLWKGLENQIYQYLDSISLEEVCKNDNISR